MGSVELLRELPDLVDQTRMRRSGSTWRPAGKASVKTDLD
jgi:hypothetical protein